MKQIRVIFIGGLTNGKIVYEYLKKNKFADICLSITYPDSFEKPRYIRFETNKYIIKTKSANSIIDKIQAINPDFIFVAGWSELLSDDLIKIPKKGTIGFHPSKLPMDRGRSVLAWQIEEGYSNTALTMFYYNNLPDAGDIIAQEKIQIEKNDYINDVLNKIDEATYNLMTTYFPMLRKGIAPRKKQELSDGNFRRLRTDKDSLIDWNRNVENIYNKIRSISRPYSGSFFVYNNRRIIVWEAEMISELQINEYFKFAQPGEILAELKENYYIVKCKDFLIKIKCDNRLKVGDII